MNRRRGRTKIVGVLLFTALMVGGCNSDPDPVVTPSPSPTPTETAAPSPSPSPTELTQEEIIEAIPPLARQEDFIGAQEFAKFFLEKSQRVLQTRETSLFAAFSSDGCTFCDRTIEFVEELRDTTDFIEGGEITHISQEAAGGLQIDDIWRIELDATVSEQRRYSSDRSMVATEPGADFRVTVFLDWDSERWSVVELGAEEQ